MQVFFDFEYREDAVLFGAFLIRDDIGNISKDEFDCRDPLEVERLAVFIEAHSKSVFLAYAAGADLDALIRLGIETRKIKVVDLMTEARMISFTHDRYFTADSTLLGQLRTFKVARQTKSYKRDMIDLIINNTEYTDEEWADIVTYCWTDVYPLPKLYDKIWGVHRATSATLSDMLERGNFVKAATILDARSQGFPVGDWFQKVYEHRPLIRDTIIKSVQDDLPNIWVMGKDKKWHFNFKNCGVFAADNNIKWALTPKGRMQMDSKYLGHLAIRHPLVLLMKTTKEQLQHLNSKDLRELEKDDWVKTKTFPYSAKTSRNGLRPKQGYLLNLPVFMRSVIEPHKNMAIVSIDYKQQEVAIAAVISGDKELEKVYRSGDPYLALGKLCGLIPPDGTKSTHATMRDVLKVLTLGIAYGMGQQSLAMSLHNMLKEANPEQKMDDSDLLARQVSAWHKNTFHVYWAWADNYANSGKARGWAASADNWLIFTNAKTKDNALVNFPTQCGGAQMMRSATKLLVNTDLDVICSQHDSFYINCRMEDVEESTAILKDCMDKASAEVCGFALGIDVGVYRAGERMIDRRGESLYNLVKDVIENYEKEN